MPAKPAKTQKTWPVDRDEALWDMKGDLLQFASLAFANGVDKLGVATVPTTG
jgi:hypothetical protein